MGRMKQMALELEEQFMEKMLEVADRSETYLSFTSEMEGHMDMVSHLNLSDVHDMMAETWGEVQETAGKEAYGNVEVYDGD
jgi:predicted dinucleotide-utilizing enzyme|tara:strand:- start:5067 stop:5309 length:243 start_codon:yes stop_codon:yes gene_type:complete